MHNRFDEIYNIMKEAFPKQEIRTYEDQLALLDQSNYHISILESESKIVGFIISWNLESFYFIEHFATSKNLRGKGLGSQLLKKYISTADKPIILEVEPATSDISKRRIEFYKRFGFHLNNYEYVQPPLQSDTSSCELKIMSYPNPLSQEEFENCRRILYHNVYNISTDK